MFRNLSTLHTPEWFKVFKPHTLVDKLLYIFRVLLSRLSKVPDKFLAYRDRSILRDYAVISIPKSSVSQLDFDTYRYKVSGISDAFEIIGYSIGSPAIRGIDYKIIEGIYYFKSDPSKYFMPFEVEGEVLYKTIGVVGALTDIPQVLQMSAPSDLVCSTNYDTMMKTNNAGISNMDVLARQGIYCKGLFTGKPVEMWEEDNRVFIITDAGSFIHAPCNAKLLIDYETPIRLLNDTPSIFFILLNGSPYPVLSGVNVVDNYPKIREQFKDLTVYGDKFIGLELLKILKNQGCNFTELSYIKYNDIGGTICQYGRYITRLEDITLSGNTAKIKDMVVQELTEEIDETINLDIEVTVRYL